MAQDSAVGDGRDITFEDVQVGTADRRPVDPHDHVGVLADADVGHLFPGLRTGTVIDERAHGLLLRLRTPGCRSSTWRGRRASGADLPEQR
jgi:hypothetical protein